MGEAGVMMNRGVAEKGIEMTTTIAKTTAVQAALHEAYDRFKNVTDGENASYIPYLANVPSSLFGLAVTTAEGETFEVGDTRYEFAIESISKAFTLALVMEQVGPDEVRAKIGADPTGMPFNSVEAIELHGGKPLTPLVNAGAMATVSLLNASTPDERWQKLLSGYSRFAGRQLSLNQEVYASEAATNFHNRAIAWLLYSYGTIYSDPMEACDVYTKQCSVGVTAADLATMGATLAAGGTNPVSKIRLVSESNVPHILAEMTMEGLYDSSGDWAYNVGLPGKSGVGGGLLAVAPGALAIASFSPPLDPVGNSVRGLQAIEYVARKLKLNVYLNSEACVLA
jgi:glutaminase